MNALEEITTLTFHTDSNSSQVWWHGRLLFVLFVNFFGAHNVNPSMCNLAICGAFYAKRIEDMGSDCGMQLCYRYLNEYPCEGMHREARQEIKKTNKKKAKPKNVVVSIENDPSYAGDRLVQQFHITLESLERHGKRLVNLYKLERPSIPPIRHELQEDPAEVVELANEFLSKTAQNFFSNQVLLIRR
jgi:hypothetical protein